MSEAQHSFLNTPVEYLKGVGPSRAEILKKELDISTYGDLLQHYPYRYVDRSKIHEVRELRQISHPVQLKGIISNIQEIKQKRGRRLTALFTDASGGLELVWFKGVKWVRESLRPGQEYVIFGKPTVYRGRINLAHPEIELYDSFKRKDHQGLRALYHTTERMKKTGLDSKGMFRALSNLMGQIRREYFYENLPAEIVKKYRLISKFESIYFIHLPRSKSHYHQAMRRLKFEELFFVQLQILALKLHHHKEKGYKLDAPGTITEQFFKEVIPFEMTGAQKRVLAQIQEDMLTGIQMNRLLQGDVGSGKTVVAFSAMLHAIDNGYQAAIMAPTEILAQQHFNGLEELAKPLGIKLGYLTGSVKGTTRKQLLKALEEGYINILVGTHALIEDKVNFKNLGIMVIDEQHRFGVAQRARLWKKSTLPPHVLVMTATPIPRTLAMTLYGDLDVSVIDELPPGRKPVKTVHRYEKSRLQVFGFLKEEIKKGRQVYIVYPLIEESEKMDLNNLMQGYEAISRYFQMPDYRVSVVHGKMKSKDKDLEMQRFARGETQIMVATTVIEVGVNIPNASVMVIENSERFGLSQLHQLRGRVGRGADQSFCILMSDYKISSDGLTRLQTMVSTNDGFKISEVDLELRGPGDIAGTRQSGVMSGLKMANLVTDGVILEEARKSAIAILEKDAELQAPQHAGTRMFVLERFKDGSYWSRIS
ncbi:MAG: ATP-dependent DNA helicase RecG [Bacteroidetes bacterium]|nr:ATP-dependent DNA helicase RecG [Bacteroidota bacterium]